MPGWISNLDGEFKPRALAVATAWLLLVGLAGLQAAPGNDSWTVGAGPNGNWNVVANGAGANAPPAANEPLSFAGTAGLSATKNDSAGTLIISNQPQQLIRLGIDGERLWYWYPNLSNTLAQLAVKNLQVNYARVAINCAYELTNGIHNPSAYDDILGEMAALKAANPNLKFFGTPRPMGEAYSPAEVASIWGGNVPWSPYPAWIETFAAQGTNSDGTTKWVAQSLNDAYLTQYLADYLNLMYAHGFTIDYLDVINEQSFVQPSDVAYVSSHLNVLLNPGVPRPLLVAPSGWSQAASASFISAANPATYDTASTHNTGGAQDPASFVTAVRSATQGNPKEIWNTELHNWVGTDLGSEVTNSRVFWDHIRAGFTGIDSWLFFGPYGGKPHSMIFAKSSSVRTSCKYEIFKQVVNNANGGNYVGVGGLENLVEAAAFTNAGVQTVWVLNPTASALTNVVFQFAGQDLTGRNIAVTTWYASGTPASSSWYDVEKYGQASGLTATNAAFSYTLNGQTLYGFRLAPPPTYPVAAITVHGSTAGYRETGGNWQTLGANDIDNDGHLGSDGYVFFGNFDGSYTSITSPSFGLFTAQLPYYVTSLAPGTNYGGVTENAGYALLDSPLLTNGIEVPAARLWGTGGAANGSQQLLKFTVAGLPYGKVVRVGVLAGVDSSSSGAWDPAAITLSAGTNSATVGNAATSQLPGDPLSGVAASCGWVFFDIVANGGYAVSATVRAGSQSAGIAGLTFDSAVASSVPAALNPTNIVATVIGGALILGWPTDHTGWTLQSQTNPLATGLGTHWTDVPGSSAVNQFTNTLNSTSGSMFYRLIYRP